MALIVFHMTAAVLAQSVLGYQQSVFPRQSDTGPGLFTLTAYAPGNAVYNGLKVEYGGLLNLFRNKTASYCPGPPSVPNCPNGTDTAFANVLYPLSEVPGGQEFYVNSDGSTQITVQHSHSFPSGSYPYYYGWNWTQLPECETPNYGCPSTDSFYNCGALTGYFTFKAPDGPANYTGGLKACPNKYDTSTTSVYAVTPLFNLTGCVDLEGLATHTYTGPNPPVWAYA